MRARILVLACVLVVGMTGIPTAVAQPENPGEEFEIEWDDGERGYEVDVDEDGNVTFSDWDQGNISEFEVEFGEDGSEAIQTETEFTPDQNFSGDWEEAEITQYWNGDRLVVRIEVDSLDGTDGETVTDELAPLYLGINGTVENSTISEESEVDFPGEADDLFEQLNESQAPGLGHGPPIDWSEIGPDKTEVYGEYNYTDNTTTNFTEGVWSQIGIENGSVDSVVQEIELELEDGEREGETEITASISDWNSSAVNMTRGPNATSGTPIEINGSTVNITEDLTNASLSVQNGTLQFDGRLSVTSKNLSENEDLNVTVDRDSGAVEFVAQGKPNTTYEIYDNGSLEETVTTDENGTVVWNKTDDWSPHDITFEATDGTSSSDDGFPTVLVVGVAFIGIVGILIYRRRQDLQSEYLS